jgi:hypothetical protein
MLKWILKKSYEVVGWINQFEDWDQLGAFVIREINFKVLINLGSVLTR